MIAELRPDAPRLADWLADTHAETLACYVLSRADERRKLCSTNAVECHHQVVRRRTYVIRIFPHEASLLRLLTALAIEQNDRWRQARWIINHDYRGGTPAETQRLAHSLPREITQNSALDLLEELRPDAPRSVCT